MLIAPPMPPPIAAKPETVPARISYRATGPLVGTRCAKTGIAISAITPIPLVIAHLRLIVMTPFPSLPMPPTIADALTEKLSIAARFFAALLLLVRLG